jgi:hypothetical protein
VCPTMIVAPTSLARCRADAIRRRGGPLHKFQRYAAHAESVLVQYRIAHAPPQFLRHNRQARQNVPRVGPKARPAGGCVAPSVDLLCIQSIDPDLLILIYRSIDLPSYLSINLSIESIDQSIDLSIYRPINQ